MARMNRREQLRHWSKLRSKYLHAPHGERGKRWSALSEFVRRSLRRGRR